MIRRPAFRRTCATCGDRPQAGLVVDWEQLTLSFASVIVGTGSIQRKVRPGDQRETLGYANPVPIRPAYPSGDGYKPHSPGG